MTLVVAIIAAVAALVAAGIALYGVKVTNDASSDAANREYTLRQLNELYGPIYMRRRLSQRLHRQLDPTAGAGPQPAQWRLIDHIHELKTEHDDRRRTVAEQILAINEELTELIIGKAGLFVSFPPPEVFAEFLEHAATLQAWWDRGDDATGPANKPFPNELDTHIDEAIATLRAALKIAA